MDLISVVMPVYQTEQYLDRCISSVCHQTYRNLEIILVEDGSKDSCPRICDRWEKTDSRVKVIHQKNQGVSAARNAGIERASGAYLVMVDSDDYLFDGMIETMYCAQKKYHTELVICGFEKGQEEAFSFPGNGENLQKATLHAEMISAKTALLRMYENDEMALQYVAPWGKLYRKELFRGISYPPGKIFEDIYVTHELLYRCGEIAVLPQKMVYYYQHSDSIMNRKFHVGKLAYLEALKQRIEFFHRNHLGELESIAYDEYLHALIWEYSRARDLLGNRNAMRDIVLRYRSAYRKGYSSKRYPKETKRFLRTFFRNPEWIIWYWKVRAKWEER